MAIGPSLPPDLAKRKRVSSASSEIRDEFPNAEKRNRTIGPTLPGPQQGPVRPSDITDHNPDKIDLDSSDDDDAYPQPPTAAAAAAHRPIGPAMPPPETNPDEIDLDDSDSDGPGPGLSSSSKPGPTVGPSMPRAIGPSLPPTDANHSSDDSEDDMGPAPPPAPGAGPSDNISAFDRPDHSANSNSASTSTAPQREAWMLAPPENVDWANKIDPTKLRNRRFVSGPRASSGSKGSGSSGMGSEWTETPEEKRRRLENAVMGVSNSGTATKSVGAGGPGGGGQGGSNNGGSSSQRKQDRETERRIKEYDQRTRGESLVKAHQRTRDKELDDDPSKRAFDREKDIGGAPKISNAQKREMMNRAADFGSRFSKGSYL